MLYYLFLPHKEVVQLLSRNSGTCEKYIQRNSCLTFNLFLNIFFFFKTSSLHHHHFCHLEIISPMRLVLPNLPR
jgi:hypothetical protein